MPISDDIKKRIVVESGFDPNKYTTDSEGDNIIPIPTIRQPAAGPSVLTPKLPVISTMPDSSMSGMKALGVSARQSALPSIGGGIGAGLGTAAAVALAPESFGASLLLPLAGSLIGSMGAGKVQEAIEPESWKQEAAQAAQQHPYLSAAGSLATLPLGGMSPSIGSVAKGTGTLGALGGLGKAASLMDAGAMTAIERQALINATAGAGMNVGVGLATDLATGQPISLGSIAENAVVGGLFTKPNRIGNMLGFHDPNAMQNIYDRINADPNAIQQQVTPQAQIQTVPPEVTQQGLLQGITPLQGHWVNRTPVINDYVPEIATGKLSAVPVEQKKSGDYKPGLAYGKEQYIPNIKQEDLMSAAEVKAQEETRIKGNTLREAIDEQTLPANKSAEESAQAITERLKQDELDAKEKALDDEIRLREKEYYLKNFEAEKQAREAERVRQESIAAQQEEFQNNRNQQSQQDYLSNKSEQERITIRKAQIEQQRRDDYEKALQEAEAEHPNNPDINNLRKKWELQKSQRNWQVEQFLDKENTRPHEGPIGEPNAEIKDAYGFPFEIGNNLNRPENTKVLSFGAKARESIRRAGEILNPSENEPSDLNLRRMEGYGDKYQQSETVGQPRLKEDEQGNLVDLNDIKPQTALGKELSGVNKAPTKSFFDVFKKWGIEIPGIKIENGNPVDAKGNPVSGKTVFEKGLPKAIELSNTKAGLDTPMHEMYHAMVASMRNSKRPRDVALVKAYDEIVRNSPDYQKWAADRKIAGYNSSVEEYQATNNGLEFVKQHLSTEKPLQKWWNDFKSYAKTRFGKHADEADYRRMMNWRISEGSEQKINTAPLSIKPAGTIEEKNQDSSQFRNYSLDNNDIKYSNYSQFGLTKPELEKVRDIGTPEANSIADATQRFRQQKDEMSGRYIAPIIKASNNLSLADKNKVQDVLLRENADKKYYHTELNAKQKVLYNAIRNSLLEKQQDQIDAKQPVTEFKGSTEVKRLPKIDPFYFPNRIAPQTIDILTQHGHGTERAKLLDDFMQHQLKNGITKESAEKKLNAILTAYEKGHGANLTKFNANREMQGVGLPDSWMRRGRLLEDMSAYINRVSSDRAWHDQFESKPEVGKAVGLTKDAWGKDYQNVDHIDNSLTRDEAVQNILERIHGESFDHSAKQVGTLNRIATSLMLGPLTNVHIAASSVANSLQYTLPHYSLQTLIHGVTHLSEGITHALENGYKRKDFSTWSQILDNNSTTLEKLGTIAKKIGNLSGRDFTDTITKGYLQAASEFIIRHKFIEANNGSKEAANLMKHIDPDWQMGKQYSEEDISKLGSQLGGVIHGTHDERTMPTWMLKETAIQPFFQLMSWNIAQTNAWMRHVWTPAKQGNFVPLIMSTLGAGVGGYVIKEMREKLADKKGSIPSLEEIFSSEKGAEGNINNLVYNFMAMASYTGFGGILTVAGKAVEDLAHKNLPQGATFPLDEMISGPAQRLAQFTSALMNDKNFDYFQGGTKLVTDLIQEHFQLGRIATSWLSNVEDMPGLEMQRRQKLLNEKTSALRRYKMVEGLPYEGQTEVTSNPYMNNKLKEFKRTEDLGEATQLLPGLIDTAFQKAEGNPEVLKAELSKIKQNTYETMPSPERMPLSFIRYLSFVSKTKGNDYASNLYQDYMKHQMINKAKTAMVPAI